MELGPRQWGGNRMVSQGSDKLKEGIDDLLEAILLVAENTDIRANPDGTIIGTVIEAEMDKTKGTVTTLLVQNGSLKVGDIVVAGTSYGRIRALFDFQGKPIEKACPSTPVGVLGFHRVP